MKSNCNLSKPDFGLYSHPCLSDHSAGCSLAMQSSLIVSVIVILIALILKLPLTIDSRIKIPLTAYMLETCIMCSSLFFHVRNDSPVTSFAEILVFLLHNIIALGLRISKISFLMFLILFGIVFKLLSESNFDILKGILWLNIPIMIFMNLPILFRNMRSRNSENVFFSYCFLTALVNLGRIYTTAIEIGLGMDILSGPIIGTMINLIFVYQSNVYEKVEKIAL